MRVFQISVQKAVAVFKKDTNFDKNNPISVAMWPVIWKLLQKNKEILLTTGAKLCIEDMGNKFYYLFSYTEDESDVAKFLKTKKIEKDTREPRDYTDKDWENGHL